MKVFFSGKILCSIMGTIISYGGDKLHDDSVRGKVDQLLETMVYRHGTIIFMGHGCEMNCLFL